MSRSLVFVFILLSAVVIIPAQQIPIINEKLLDSRGTIRVDLVSPWIVSGTKTSFDKTIRGRNCLDLVDLEQYCNGAETVDYGDRIGDHWDIFAISGRAGSRTRMIDLGVHTWSDNFTIPEVEPWPALKPGERRSITINTSGANGTPGRDADTRDSNKKPKHNSGNAERSDQKVDYAHAPLSRQVTSTISVQGKAAKPDSFSPVTEVNLGHMYLIHVVNSSDDHYVLLRADNVVRGEKVSVSFCTFRLVDN
jgi:hypothetical protein